MYEPVKRGYAYYFRKGKIEVDNETGCWIWLGAQYTDGYGKIRRPNSGMPIRAQRYFWELYKGTALGLDVSHKCHRRLCINIRHLEAIRHSENMHYQYTRYVFGPSDRAMCQAMMIEGADSTLIADAMMAPRMAVVKLMAEIGAALKLDQSGLPF